MRAQPIDRLAWTRKKFGAKMYGDKDYPKTPENYPKAQEHREGYSTCPHCGLDTLRHEGSCTMCENCGYSKCG